MGIYVFKRSAAPPNPLADLSELNRPLADFSGRRRKSAIESDLNGFNYFPEAPNGTFFCDRSRIEAD